VSVPGILRPLSSVFDPRTALDAQRTRLQKSRPHPVSANGFGRSDTQPNCNFIPVENLPGVQGRPAPEMVVYANWVLGGYGIDVRGEGG
jgi:hypothetical protein